MPNSNYINYLKFDGSSNIQLTYADLLEKSSQLASNLLMIASPGDRIILCFTSGVEFIISFWACQLANLVPVPVPAPSNQQQINRLEIIQKDSGAQLTLINQQLSSSAINLQVIIKNICLYEDLVTETAPYQTPKLAQSHELALLQYTSGSTSAPKAVMITHSNIIANCAQFAYNINNQADDILVSWLPHYHDMGLIGSIIFPAIFGIPVIMLSPLDFMRRPKRWLQAISDYQGTISPAPNFAYDLCYERIKDEQMKDLDLSSWNLALNGAEPIHYSSLEKFSQKFSTVGFELNNFYPAYGLAEASLFVTGGERYGSPNTLIVDSRTLERNNQVTLLDSQEDSSKILVGCGKTQKNQSLIIVADNETAAKELVIGEIAIEGKNVTQGYLNHDNDDYFITIDNTAYLKTGDLGFLYHDELYVTGRCKELIIIRGKNYYPQDIELIAENSHEDVRQGESIAFSINDKQTESMVLLIGIRPKITADIKEKITLTINKKLSRELGIKTQVIYVKPIDIHKTSSGKKRRLYCKKLYLDESVPA